MQILEVSKNNTEILYNLPSGRRVTVDIYPEENQLVVYAGCCKIKTEQTSANAIVISIDEQKT